MGEAGDTTEAVAAFEQLLGEMIQVLGSEHPQTLATRAALNRWRAVAGITGANEEP
ncbi:MAG TPA: hypothetical protein VI365_31020 [Trebonia sp.]